MAEPLSSSPTETTQSENGRLTPTQTLPANATFYHRLTLATWQFNLLLNLGGILVLLIAIWIFLGVALLLRPQFSLPLFLYRLNLFTFLLTLAVVMGLHELVHFLFHWLFCKKLPRLSFKLLFAEPASSRFYIPRNQFVMTALAPLVLLTAVGLIWLTQSSLLFLPLLILALAINVAGSIGDITLALWLLSHPAHSYIHDEGNAIAIYRVKG